MGIGRWATAFGVGIVLAGGVCRGKVTFLGYAVVDGSQPDMSGLTNKLEDGSSNGMFDGFGSGIAYAGQGNRYVLMADRGPNKTPYGGGDAVDNTTSYNCRFQIADINVIQEGAGWKVSVKLVGTSVLRDEDGRGFVGLSTAIQSGDPTKNLRLDPESIRVAPDGSVYISDEYGPNIYHFDRNGKRIGVLAVPEKFKIARLRPTEVEEIEQNAYVAHSGKGGGRVTNKGMEGLAITPDGSKLIAAMQCPLLQDGGDKTRYVRFVEFDLRDAAAKPKEFLYVLSGNPDKPGNYSHVTISEIVAVNDHQLLVDERDGAKINETKHLFLADLNGAQDISGIYSLSDLSEAEMAAVVPVQKGEKPFIDVKQIVEPRLPGEGGFLGGIPDKIEGLAFGPDLPDGRHLLLVTNDNDFVSPIGVKGYPNYVFAFAIDAGDLGLEAERFNADVAAMGGK